MYKKTIEYQQNKLFTSYVAQEIKWDSKKKKLCDNKKSCVTHKKDIHVDLKYLALHKKEIDYTKSLLCDNKKSCYTKKEIHVDLKYFVLRWKEIHTEKNSYSIAF